MQSITRNALFVLLFFVTNAIQTITGFGGGILTVPFAMLLFDKSMATGQINLLGLPLSLFIACKERAHIRWQYLAKIIIFMGLGILAGAAVQPYLSFTLLYKLYGCFILVSVGVLALRKQQKPFPPAVDILLLLCAGIIHHFFASGGPLLVVYLMSRLQQKDDFRATINAAWVPLNVLLAIEHWRAGIYTADFLKMSLVLLPALLLGMAVGVALYRRVSAKIFLVSSYILLVGIGIYILVF
ncbi:MAG: sulfite exporter TauE/SafE family protein [Oscillospiraceae bacterium]